jgi:hypothetical protein
MAVQLVTAGANIGKETPIQLAGLSQKTMPQEFQLLLHNACKDMFSS